jgi:hypothetical protein
MLITKNGNYMKLEPHSFADLDGVLIVKTLARSVNLGDRGVAHFAQNKLDLDRLARSGTHGVARQIN